ncbi:hypothetical protein GCM10009754_63330 [Amycolatopsis minnesotensis]|uniref:Uncharacterized protein n=1 Tax=Amycolatopsis minnesotensis TaxID=337894 RepID=A0ABP5DDZ9_9PSEU
MNDGCGGASSADALPAVAASAAATIPVIAAIPRARVPMIVSSLFCSWFTNLTYTRGDVHKIAGVHLPWTWSPKSNHGGTGTS